jgi:hypothetical protein
MSSRIRSLPWFRIPGARYEAAIESVHEVLLIKEIEPPEFFFCMMCGYPEFGLDVPDDETDAESYAIANAMMDRADVQRVGGVTYVNGIVRLHQLLCDACAPKRAA